MNIDQLHNALQHEVKARPYFLRLELLELTTSLLKARLVITPQLFVQIYRNDRFDTTNLALIHDGQRLYARDQLDGRWHRHPVEAPERHDHGDEGQRAVSLHEFLNEVEDILAARGLP